MKRQEITTTKIRLTLSPDDVYELLPKEEFKYVMYYSYDDEITQRTLSECMPDESKYKNEDGTIEHHNFAQDWRTNLEDKVWEWNIDWITMQIENELRDKVEKALEKKWIEFDELDLDFYPDDLYSIDLDLDYILGRSRVDWNVVWRSNFDGFSEGETYEDDWAIKQIVKLFPDLVNKYDLERACRDWMYTGSDLKVNYKSSMLDFLNIIESGKMDISWASAVLHLSINGSWSPEFTLWKWVVEFGRTYWTKFDWRDWWLDWHHYWVHETYWWAINVL